MRCYSGGGAMACYVWRATAVARAVRSARALWVALGVSGGCADGIAMKVCGERTSSAAVCRCASHRSRRPRQSATRCARHVPLQVRA